MAEPKPTPVAAPSSSDAKKPEEELNERSTVALSAEDGVLLLALDPKASFEALREAVRELFSASPDRFRGKDARLDLATRPIDLFDLRRLVHVLSDEFGISVTGLYCTEQHLHRYAERELKLKVYPRRAPTTEPSPPADTPALESTSEDTLAQTEAEPNGEPEPTPTEVQVVDEPEQSGPQGRRQLTLERGLRSGQAVSFNGDVTVFGDVNPGAQLVASGNIVVLGALKGMVHAGSEGDEQRIVMAFDFQPSQLRIGRHIVREEQELRTTTRRSRLQALSSALPSPELLRGGRSAPTPMIAWIGGDQGIQIEPYAGRLPASI
ncbi:MAG: septum site-determining protein MinC [Myxococcota bacterium]|nr:septum site-determining protein MinC [Myxococcota bacterium]